MKGCPDCEKRMKQARATYWRNRDKRKAKALAYYYGCVRPYRKENRQGNA